MSSKTLKFGYSEKATKFGKNLPLKILRYSVTSNFKWKIFSNFVAFSEYPNFKAVHSFEADAMQYGLTLVRPLDINNGPVLKAH